MRPSASVARMRSVMVNASKLPGVCAGSSIAARVAVLSVASVPVLDPVKLPAASWLNWASVGSAPAAAETV